MAYDHRHLAIISILKQERGHDRLWQCIAEVERPKIGAPTQVEAGMVLIDYLGLRGRTLLARFLQETRIETVPFTEDHWTAALDAFSHFGKGRNRACLNFGDCLTYATAYVAEEPLLFVGKDFALTDLPVVNW
jgi:ribonuclease VapC